MVGGVGFFSYIMGNFIEILTSYEKKMGVENKEPDLYSWMAIIDRFTSSPIQKNLGLEILDNFHYYWSNDRLSCLNTEDYFMTFLPRKLQI